MDETRGTDEWLRLCAWVDVVVIGAGSVGTWAARELAKRRDAGVLAAQGT